jgi:hypothetical protein
MSLKQGYCIVSISPVRAEKRDASEMVTQLLFGEVITIEEVESPWCKITTYSDNYTGFIDIKHVHFLSEKETNRWLDGLSYEKKIVRKLGTPWGIQSIFRGSFIPFENPIEFNIGKDHFKFIENSTDINFTSIVDLALDFINTPYLWGGKTPFGIDCSGLTQTVYRFFGINLPRDAAQQIDYGETVAFEYIEPGDLAFFTNKDLKIIHVGIIDGFGSIIHASGFVRKDKLTKDGIIHSETGFQTHQLHAIKRL